MDIELQLISLGFSAKEAKIYLTALELGQFSVSGLAAKSGIKRPTCYVLVSALMKRGLITAVPQARKTLYMAEPPDQLLLKVRQQVNQVNQLLPELKQHYKISGAVEPMVKFFRGRTGVEAIYGEMIKRKPKQIYALLNTDKLLEVTGEEFINNWIAKRVADGIAVRNIQIPSRKFKDKYHGNNEKYMRDSRFFPENKDLPAAISFYDDKVAVISSKADDFSFTVRSKELAQTMKTIFETLWDRLPEPKD